MSAQVTGWAGAAGAPQLLAGAAALLIAAAAATAAPALTPAGRWLQRVEQRAIAGRARGGPVEDASRGGGQHVLVAAAGAAAGWLLGGAVGALVVVAALAGSLRLRAQLTAQRRTAALERDVAPLARSMADALRGGRSLRGALLDAAGDRALSGAMRTELARVAARLQHGESTTAGIAQLGAAGGPSLRLLAGAAALHSETGGRLAGELERLAGHAERAARADDERAAATAQARATVRMVGALPLLALAGGELLGGGLIGSIGSSPAGLALLFAGFTLQLAAVLAARAIVGPAR